MTLGRCPLSIFYSCGTPPIRLTDSCLVGSSGGVPRGQKILKEHLPIVIYHQVYQYTKIKIQIHNDKWLLGTLRDRSETVDECTAKISSVLILPPLLSRINLLRSGRSIQDPSRRGTTRRTFLGGVPREQKMLKRHLSTVMYHQVY